MKKLSLLPLALLAASALGLTGCASNDHTAAANRGPAVLPAPAGLPASRTVGLTVYRQSTFVGSAIHPTLSLNGQELVTIGSGEVFHARLSPGHYLFEDENKKTGAQFDAKPGEEYYFRVTIVPGVFAGQGEVTLVAPQQGAFDSLKCKPIDRDSIDNKAFR